MGYYNWEKIFKDKNEKELIDIYSGNSYLDYEASIFAGLELQIRNYDFDKIQKIHNQKIEKLKTSIEEFKQLKYTKSKYFRNQIFYTIGLVPILLILVQNGNSLVTIEDYSIFIYLGVFGIEIATAKWSYNRFKKRKKEAIEKQTNLLKLITIPYK